jgi:hypothetical protein
MMRNFLIVTVKVKEHFQQDILSVALVIFQIQ